MKKIIINLLVIGILVFGANIAHHEVILPLINNEENNSVEYKAEYITNDLIYDFIYSGSSIETQIYYEYYMMNNSAENILINNLSNIDESIFNEAIDMFLLDEENDSRFRRYGLEYYYEDLSTNQVKTNVNDNKVETLLNQNIEDYQNDYYLYLEIIFDENGDVEIIANDNVESSLLILNDTHISNYISNVYLDEYNGEEILSVEPIKNFRVVYGFNYDTNIDSYLYRYDIMILNNYVPTAIMSSILVSCLFLFIGLMIPRKIYDNSFIMKLFVKIPMEIYILVIPIICIMMIQVTEALFYYTNDIELFKELFGQYFWIILVIFGLIAYFIGILIRQILKLGFISAIKNHTISFKLVKLFVKIIRKMFGSIFDFKNYFNDNKKNKTIISVNIILIVYALIVFGITISTHYLAELAFINLIVVICLIIFVNKLNARIQSDYKKLSVITKKLSGGDLNFKSEEDLGVFNVIKDDLEDIKIGFKKAVEEEVKSSNMKTQLITNVSHDLKTPLTNIINYTEILKDDKFSEEEKEEYLQIIVKNSNRLKNLIEDLFTVSKLSSGNVEVDVTELDLIGLINQVEIDWENKLKEKQITIVKNYKNESLKLNSDPNKLHRIFDNLYSNAEKYALENTRLYIDIQESEDNVEILLRNISKTIIDFSSEEIQERFVRGDKSRNSDGNGLGLAIVKNLVEVLNGKFEIMLDGDLFKVKITFNK